MIWGKLSPPSSEKKEKTGASDFSDYFVHSFKNYPVHHVSRFRVVISVAYYAILYVPMFMTYSVYLFSLCLLAYLYSLFEKSVFRWPLSYLCQCMCLSPYQVLKILNYFYEIWYVCYDVRCHYNYIYSNFQQLKITKLRMRIILRQSNISDNYINKIMFGNLFGEN
jgi:hypothetical protein